MHISSVCTLSVQTVDKLCTVHLFTAVNLITSCDVYFGFLRYFAVKVGLPY